MDTNDGAASPYLLSMNPVVKSLFFLSSFNPVVSSPEYYADRFRHQLLSLALWIRRSVPRA
jgi:hypothetical protein